MISLFKNTFSKEVKNFTPIQVITWIMDGQWREKVEALRKMSKEEYNKAKLDLPGITWSGTFSQRLADKLESYSGLIVLDIDNLNPQVVNDIKARLTEEPCVFCAFTSPSGNGLKIVCAVDTGPEHQRAAFEHLKSHFEEKYELEVDKSGKDICRLCFVSYDPFAVLQNPVPFEVNIAFGEVAPRATRKMVNTAPLFDSGKIFEVCKRWVEKHYNYSEGQRNVFVHAVACAMNRCGVPMDTTIGIFNGVFDLPETEIRHSVKSAYFRNVNEHGSVSVSNYGAMDDQPIPVYETDYSEDIVENDIMRTTAMLYEKKVKPDDAAHIVTKLAKYYIGAGLTKIGRSEIAALMNQAIGKYNENQANVNAQKSLKYMFAEDLADMIVRSKVDERALETGFEPLNKALRGGFMPGNSYGIIGPDKTYKSVLAQWLCVYSAVKNNKACLYLCGEMSAVQFYERLCLMVYNVNLYDYLKNQSLNSDNVNEFIAKMNEALHNNIFVVFNSGWNKENTLATIEDIKSKYDKTIEMVVFDGVTQMDWGREKNEIGATINNSMVLKDLAKEAHEGRGVVTLGIYHISGELNKLYRPMGDKVRGGTKTRANMDGYFSHSLFKDDKLEDTPNDISYIEGKFFCRYTDKRNGSGDVDMIMTVPDDLAIKLEHGNPNVYERPVPQIRLPYNE